MNGTVRVGRKNKKSKCSNDVKATVKRIETECIDVLGANMKFIKRKREGL